MWISFSKNCDYLTTYCEFQAILNGFFHDFPQAVKQAAEYIVGAAVEIYNRMSAELLPTPAKSHYVFNLRDLSKCVQGECSITVHLYN